MRALTPLHIQRIDDKISLLVRYHEELLEDLPSREDFFKERLPRRGIEKTIELIADAIVDVAMIVISAKGLERPAEAADAITVLEKEKVLTSKLAAKLKDLVRFRNLLVHQYAKVDEKKEYDNINQNHEDITQFVREIEVLLKKEKK